MTLNEFISANIEAILAEWESFAHTPPSASQIDKEALRNASEESLLAITASGVPSARLQKRPL